MRLDAHQHFWRYHSADYGWIDEPMSMLRKDFLPEDLAPFLHQHKFDGCVAVQSEQSEKGTAFLIQQATLHPFIKGVVGWVDLTAGTIQNDLARYQQHPIVKGFRHVLQGEKDRAFMLRPDFLKGIAALEHFSFTYDILIFPDQLPFIESFVARFPQQKFIIDHLAKPSIKTGEIEKWQRNMRKIAAFTNVYCKLSGMVTEADWQEWHTTDFTPYLDAVVDAFSPQRLVYGSDWPVCLVAASYRQQLMILEEYFAAFSEAEKKGIFGGNAAHFYHLT